MVRTIRAGYEDKVMRKPTSEARNGVSITQETKAQTAELSGFLRPSRNIRLLAGAQDRQEDRLCLWRGTRAKLLTQ